MSLLPDWLTGYDSENAQRAADADAALRQLNKQQAAVYGPDWEAQVNRDYATQQSFDLQTQREQVDTAFTDELDARAKSIIGGPLGVVWSTLKAILKAIPWWVWLAAGVAVFFWLGGFPWLARKSKGVLK
jgi:hypothetical protein